MSDQAYEPVGRCIYCGSTENLEDEHPLPYALGGKRVLPKSSCRSCARITGAVEQDVLRGPMWNVRIHRQLDSRTGHRNAPANLPATLIKGEEVEEVELPREVYPVLYGFPVFLSPGELRKEDYDQGIQMLGQLVYSFGPTPSESTSQQGADSITLSQSYRPTDFARMIAKITYSVAAAKWALERVEETPVVSSILGKTNDIGRWVGTLDVEQWMDVLAPGDSPTFIPEGENAFSVNLQLENETSKDLMRSAPTSRKEALHEVLLFEAQFARKRFLVGSVQLFADTGTPAYGVLLGRLKD